MNKRVDFSNLGGLPVDQDMLDFMQQSYRSAFSAIANLCGNKTILTGVKVIGSNVSAGWISYNGELIPFLAGGTAAAVFIDETSTPLIFQDNSTKNIEFTKVAYCANPGTFPFSDLKRLNTLQEVWLPGDLKQVICDAAYITANFDNNGIGQNERLGWKICNEMGGRVAVGYSMIDIDPSDNVWDAVYNTIGATGGEKKHQLTIAEMPSHSHNVGASARNADGSGKLVGGNAEAPDGNQQTDNIGGDAPHENRQPFKVILYIEKL